MTKMTPDPCECGSRGFTRYYFLREGEEQIGDESEGQQMRGEGWRCVECGRVQLTRKIPEKHAKDNNLDLPESADLDLLREE